MMVITQPKWGDHSAQTSLRIHICSEAPCLFAHETVGIGEVVVGGDSVVISYWLSATVSHHFMTLALAATWDLAASRVVYRAGKGACYVERKSTSCTNHAHHVGVCLCPHVHCTRASKSVMFPVHEQRYFVLAVCTRPPPFTGYYFLEVLNANAVLCALRGVGWVLFFDFLFVIYGEDTASFEAQ